LSAPRLEIHLERLRHNAQVLVERLGQQGIEVTGVSKATLGDADIVRTWVAAGIGSIGESRIESIEALAASGVTVPMLLIRAPMLSQVERVVAHAAISCNSEPVVLEALARTAARQGVRHGVVLMVELGDLREGILAADLEAVAQLTLALPNLELMGIGTNLGCQHGVAPDASNMAELSRLATALERRFSVHLPWCSGGNSANLPWLAAGGEPGRVNHLRLGEALLLGREPLGGTAIPGLHTDAITLVTEVIEAKTKPSHPWGQRRRTSFSSQRARPQAPGAHAGERRVLVAVGEQDVDPAGLSPPEGVAIRGASSDHLVIGSCGTPPQVGDELRFGLSYSALLRAMTSPFVSRCLIHDRS
jgi:predicted amino acid racemase